MRKILLIFCLLFGIPSSAIAQNGSPTNTHIRIYKGKKDRPGMPSKDFIELTFLENNLFVILPDNINYLDVEFYQNNELKLVEFVSTGNSSIDISDLNGEYEILCRDAQGQVYIGTISVQTT